MDSTLSLFTFYHKTATESIIFFIFEQKNSKKSFFAIPYDHLLTFFALKHVFFGYGYLPGDNFVV